MKPILTVLISFSLAAVLGAEEYRHFADFALQSSFKVTGTQVKPIPTKPIVFHVATDGVRVRVTLDGDDEARRIFEIYRSDGIGRQVPGAPTLDVIPGVQASCNIGGVLRHLRLTREALTITTFPGVSDQTIVTHAVAIAATKPPLAKTVSNPNPSP